MIKKIIPLLFFSAFFIAEAQTTYNASSQQTFDNALASASTGDIIEWDNGTYSNIFMDIDKAGITVKSETPGGVIFNGSSKVEIDESANDVIFDGFQYLGGDIGTDNVVRIYGSNVLFQNVNIAEYTSYKYLIIEDESQYTTVKNCNFEHRINNPDQNILSILVSSTQAGYHKIQYCSFKNFDGEPDTSGSIGDAGVEAIRIGVSTTAQYESKSIVEYCYFTNCNGDGEIISHKATECVYRYNTFENNPSSELVLRHGDKGIVYGNFFMNNMGGVRIQEAGGHVIYNNYFNNLSSRSVYLRNDDSDLVEDILIAYNTFANTEMLRLSQSESSTTDAPENVTIANNVFYNTGNDDVIRYDTGNETWYGNLYDGDIDLATTPTSGLTNVNPQLTLNAEGFYSIAATSPAIDSAVDGYPSLPVFSQLAYDSDILLDIMESTRPTTESLKDVGCQEFSSTTVLKPHVTEKNTGPEYIYSTLSVNTVESSVNTNFNFFPNPLVDNTINYSFTVEDATEVKVDVYSLSGKKITSLVDKNYDRGSYTFSEEINLTSGLYMMRVELTSANNTAVKIQKIIK